MKRPRILNPNFYPTDEAIATIPSIIDCLVYGCVPERPIIDRTMNIVAFGSCFAGYITKYLLDAGYKIGCPPMGDAFVNTFVIRQQFEWLWLDKAPTIPLRKGSLTAYSDALVSEMKRQLNNANVFILTLGLSEVWHGEKFQVATQTENLANLRAIVSLIRQYRPTAQIIFTLSPVPLKSTFRNLSCVVANEASKASLRSAIDELMAGTNDKALFYFPSYELVKNFNHPYIRDRRHIHQHVIDFMMSVFDCYFCGGVSQRDLLGRFSMARKMDRTFCGFPLQPMDDERILVAENGRLDRSYRSVHA